MENSAANSHEVVTKLQEELISYKEEFSKQASNSPQLNTFWLRKSGKVVLSVVATFNHSSQEIEFFRGMNIEVSLPAGSLCAERNAIGSAMTNRPQLKREEFLGVATVMFQLEDIQQRQPSTLNSSNSSESSVETSTTQAFEDENPIWPCGVCSEWLKKITKNSDGKFIVLAFADQSCTKPQIKCL